MKNTKTTPNYQGKIMSEYIMSQMIQEIEIDFNKEIDKEKIIKAKIKNIDFNKKNFINIIFNNDEKIELEIPKLFILEEYSSTIVFIKNTFIDFLLMICIKNPDNKKEALQEYLNEREIATVFNFYFVCRNRRHPIEYFIEEEEAKKINIKYKIGEKIKDENLKDKIQERLEKRFNQRKKELIELGLYNDNRITTILEKIKNE